MIAGEDAGQTFELHRRRLTGLAYRMLGSLAEAEDIMQDAYLRWHKADRNTVADARAYLSSTVARLCLDHLKSARVRREQYVGPWLPEPIVDPSILAPDTASELADDLSVALMMTLDRNVAACRQLAARARAHVHDERPRFNASPEDAARLSDAFHQAVLSGNVAGLGQMLAADAVLYTDGGGKRTAALNPIRGSDKIMRFFAGIAQKGGLSTLATFRRLSLNGLPGFIFVDDEGAIETLALEINDGRIAAIYAVRNPEKLGHLKAMQ